MSVVPSPQRRVEGTMDAAHPPRLLPEHMEAEEIGRRGCCSGGRDLALGALACRLWPKQCHLRHQGRPPVSAT
eukprot:CAMPEP_0170571078 /NCGR_PEP_ID=MMETSP0224-20130122/1466_1 /TAXON_ID=285029 /ORGANISM="Togula jolla, Strain CCCM 725" /LENGTH=72 /DNA_ID=CAMNT_0010893427 /DNA_START=156 /DNA_END=374 /DNA_ORIENTATION=-